MSLRVGLIWAEARDGAIGRAGQMPWHLPEDLAHFKRSTMNRPVIMGRHTWQSLPAKQRPLPGRQNIVITRDESFTAEGATVARSLDQALRAVVSTTAVTPQRVDDAAAIDVWIMGGGQVYAAAMPFADDLLVTRIGLEVPDADTFAPALGDEWQTISSEPHETSKSGLAYRFDHLVRRIE